MVHARGLNTRQSLIARRGFQLFETQISAAGILTIENFTGLFKYDLVKQKNNNTAIFKTGSEPVIYQ